MFVASLIIVVAVMLLLCYLIGDQQEGFWGWRRHGPRYCPNCGDHGPSSCMRCHNCGWGVSTSGHAECLPGGPRGPLFSSNTVHWRYGGNRYVPGRYRYGPRHIPYNRHVYHNPWWHLW